ncbi:MAG: response regulator transcription factor [Clostridia bacterium]|nr:response regulator transcription factor [Clostridia bacterium]
MRILLVEDDQALAQAIAYRLRKEEMTVDREDDGLAGFMALKNSIYDTVLLDRMLPGMDGVTLLKRMRGMGNHTPVLMLTAMDGIADRVVGLNAGADDYLVKPFAMDEMIARIRALLRRPARWLPQNTAAAGDLLLDTECMLLRCNACERELSRREGQLLTFLLNNPGQVLPRSLLLDRVWMEAAVEEGNLDIYIHFLRRKLKDVNSVCRIQTIRGIGYLLSVPKPE